ncbi:MAG: hypothetical protein K2H38_08065 [Muribaculaceae bacterium]|nr:hypothetical protein [Muribaculaceae bacterium]
MELKEFIKAAITDITDAISELQNELGNNAVVSPPMPSPIALKTLQHEGRNRLISDIDFNVAITVGSVDSIEGNAGAGVLQVFSAKVNAGKESKTEKVSRISFSIPVIYPTAEVKTDRELKIESERGIIRQKNPRSRSSITVDTSATREQE